ncbi:MAG: hypothetical protein ACI9EW_003100 [Cellvibrionaceae bacterium]|jgi:hypothetical protein
MKDEYDFSEGQKNSYAKRLNAMTNSYDELRKKMSSERRKAAKKRTPG